MIGPDANINGPIKLDQSIIIYGKVFGDISTRGSIRVAKDGIVMVILNVLMLFQVEQSLEIYNLKGQ